MDGYNFDEKVFFENVKDHKITVLRDDGLYRHLRFAKDNPNFEFAFELITWPNFLAITGDMGSYTFSRVEDMFRFFRGKTDAISINPGYWSEKVHAESMFGEGIKQFSINAFHENVLEAVRNRLDLEPIDDIPQEIMNDIAILLGAEDEWEAVESMRTFSSRHIDFPDFWERSCKRYTYHFLWCCYAIVWGIRQYDAVKGTTANCLDCGKPYHDFGLDMVLPENEWLIIHPERDGVICPNCIVKRASKLDDVITVSATLNFFGDLDHYPRAMKLIRDKKDFIVIASHEPYFMKAYALIREQETNDETWTPDDEAAYQKFLAMGSPGQ